MKTPKLSIFGTLLGLFIIITGAIRYLFIYDNPFKFLTGFAVGGLLVLCSYGYHWMRKTDHDIKRNEKRTDAIVAWWTKDEAEEVRKIARGEDE